MPKFFGKLAFSSIIAFCLLILLSVSVFAQDLDDVTISGKVVDSNNAPIAGASVTATLVSTNIERTVTTNDDGFYRFIELKPGIYKIKVSASGFGAKERIDLQTISGQNLQLNFDLDPAGVQVDQTVTVTEEDAPAVDTTRTVVGGTVTQREIEELPNNTRNPLDLVFTLGGVTEEPLSTRDLSFDKGERGETAPRTSPEEAGIFALSGGAAYSNNITIDGFDNNDDRVAGFRFQPSIESIEEVQVINNQFSAEYGRASGGRVNIRTRAGARKLRGRAFYFFEDESLNANSWSNNRRLIPRYPYQQNVPGVTLGGPIPFGYFKGKTFFYGAYEYDNIYDTTITDTYIPLVQNPRFPLPAPNTNEVIVDFPNTVNAVSLGRFIQGTDTPRIRHTVTGRIDHNFTSKHSITLNYQYGNTSDKRQFNGGNRLAEALIGRRNKTHAVNFTDNFVLNSKSVNQFRFQYSTLKPQFVAEGQFTNPVVLISFREPNLTFNTNLTAGSSTLGSSDRSEDRWQIQDTFSYILNNHSLKFGFDLQRIESTYIDLNDASGTFNFADPLAATTVPQCLVNPNVPTSGRIRSGANAYARGCVVRYRHNFFTDSTQENTYYGIFAQDDFKIFKNFTVGLGIRYERETIIDDTNNWGPRIGIAWSPFKDGKGVIRFGTGIFYNRVLLRTVDDFQRGQNEIIFDTNRVTTTGAARDAYLLQLSNSFPQVLTPDSPLVQQYIAAGLNNNAFFRSLDPTIKIPESYQINLGFEREIGKDYVFEANFTYNRTARLWRERNTNAPVIPVGFTDLADYLANGITTGTTRFEFAGINAPDSRTNAGVTYYNLNSQNTSTAAATPYGRALAVANTLRPQPTLGQTEQVGSLGNSWYRGLVMELRRRYRKLGYGFGLSMRGVYTLSYLEDDGIVNTSSAQTQGNFALERSRSLLDRRHRFAFSGSIDTPKWFGGLRFSPIFRFGSSAPFNLSNGGDEADDRNLDDVNTDRPDYTGNLKDITWRRITDPTNNTVIDNLFLSPIGRSGNLPRNSGKGPRQYIFDLNVSRQFSFGERIRIRPQVEFNNIFNMTVYSFGSEFIDASIIAGTPTQTDLANFLVPTRALRPRQIRFGLRIDF